MRTFSVKNFERFQHYKDRAPPWIKLYNELLDDYDFGKLPDASKMHLIAIWLLASRSENKIPYDPVWVSRRINATDKVDLDLLARSGFILVDQPLKNVGQDASNVLAECLPRDRGEGETESICAKKVLKEKREDDFEDCFWPLYPRKKAKGDARLAWKKATEKASVETILEAVKRFAAKCAGKDENYTPYPASWLNGEHWQDADLQASEPLKLVNHGVYVKVGTPAWDAWEAHNGKSSPRDKYGVGWYFPSEYPPDTRETNVIHLPREVPFQ